MPERLEQAAVETSGRPPLAIIPLKAIARSKSRMAPTLSPADRALLLHRSFDRVVAACDDAALDDVLVVVGDPQGASWARQAGAGVLPEPAGGGLNGAIGAADRAAGDRTTLVVPADLPLVTGADLRAVVDAAGSGPTVVVSPTADGGTGALLRQPGGIISPLFGPGSARRHAAAAAEAGAAVVWCTRPGLALDLDQPDDITSAGGWDVLTAPAARGREGGTASPAVAGEEYPAG